MAVYSHPQSQRNDWLLRRFRRLSVQRKDNHWFASMDLFCDILSLCCLVQGHLVLRHFDHAPFCPATFCLNDVLSCDNLADDIFVLLRWARFRGFYYSDIQSHRALFVSCCMDTFYTQAQNIRYFTSMLISLFTFCQQHQAYQKNNTWKQQHLTPTSKHHGHCWYAYIDEHFPSQ